LLVVCGVYLCAVNDYDIQQRLLFNIITFFLTTVAV